MISMPALNISKPIHFGKFIVTTSVFHTSPLSFAIVNLKPILPGHVLVSPLRVVPRFSDLTPAEVSDLFLTVQKVSRTLTRLYDASALNIAIQDGVDAGQSVPHVHAHVIPRRKADLDEEGGNDVIYEMMDGTEGNVGGHLEAQSRRGARVQVDADEDRKPRSDEEMAQEARWLASEMEKDAEGAT
jgi:bis(5'-adenosyl)-triphosphatase